MYAPSAQEAGGRHRIGGAPQRLQSRRRWALVARPDLTRAIVGQVG